MVIAPGVPLFPSRGLKFDILITLGKILNSKSSRHILHKKERKIAISIYSKRYLKNRIISCRKAHQKRFLYLMMRQDGHE